MYKNSSPFIAPRLNMREYLTRQYGPFGRTIRRKPKNRHYEVTQPEILMLKQVRPNIYAYVYVAHKVPFFRKGRQRLEEGVPELHCARSAMEDNFSNRAKNDILEDEEYGEEDDYGVLELLDLDIHNYTTTQYEHTPRNQDNDDTLESIILKGTDDPYSSIFPRVNSFRPYVPDTIQLYKGGENEKEEVEPGVIFAWDDSESDVGNEYGEVLYDTETTESEDEESDEEEEESDDDDD